LRRDELVAVKNCSFTTVVGIRWRALASFAAVRSLLIELATGEAVERPHEQKHCYEGDCNVNATMHSSSKYHSSFDGGHNNNQITLAKRKGRGQEGDRFPVGAPG
jgi:hypothetical protein